MLCLPEKCLWNPNVKRPLKKKEDLFLQLDLRKMQTYFYCFGLKSQSIQSVDSFLCILGVNVVHKAVTQALP